MDKIWTISAKNSEGDFEQHRFFVSGPHYTLDDARKAKEEVEEAGFHSVKIAEVDDDQC